MEYESVEDAVEALHKECKGTPYFWRFDNVRGLVGSEYSCLLYRCETCRNTYAIQPLGAESYVSPKYATNN